MEWEFTPEQVVKAEVGYGLEDFRRDLAAEVRGNLGPASPEQVEQTTDLLYDLCHTLATNRTVESMLETLAYDPPTCEFLRGMVEPMRPNGEMLGAILQRMIMDRVESGMPLEQALESVAEHHRQAVAND
ncbi:MAG: hypothetical protein BIFFINMI_04186 [Phycisphaerae bacterium]|nr:hypothetical protein [Phycisphaerae bacterium]CAG0931890.1 hypothetical protein RHDC3_02020 [Rhodocyclaceae bacterium]